MGKVGLCRQSLKMISSDLAIRLFTLDVLSLSKGSESQKVLLASVLGVLWMPKPKHHSVLFSLWTLSYPVVCGRCVNLKKKVSIAWLRPKHKSQDG